MDLRLTVYSFVQVFLLLLSSLHDSGRVNSTFSRFINVYTTFILLLYLPRFLLPLYLPDDHEPYNFMCFLPITNVAAHVNFLRERGSVSFNADFPYAPYAFCLMYIW